MRIHSPVCNDFVNALKLNKVDEKLHGSHRLMTFFRFTKMTKVPHSLIMNHIVQCKAQETEIGQKGGGREGVGFQESCLRATIEMGEEEQPSGCPLRIRNKNTENVFHEFSL